MTKPARIRTPSRSGVKRPTKPGRARVRASERPPPESAALRDRRASSEPTFERPVAADDVAERMGQDVVTAMTSGEDESEDERGDGEADADGEAVNAERADVGSLFDDPVDEDDPDEDDADDDADEETPQDR